MNELDKYVNELKKMGFIYGWKNDSVDCGVEIFLFFNKTPHLIKDCSDVDVAIDIVNTNNAKRFCCTTYDDNTYASKVVDRCEWFNIRNNKWDIAFCELKEYLKNNVKFNGLIYE